MLNDQLIRQHVASGMIGIEPTPEDRAFQPASIDLRLGRDFIDVLSGQSFNLDGLSEDQAALTLDVHQATLGCTLETVTVPAHLVARVEGKSTWGRRFLMVHATAGFIDPGFTGQVTLELVNLGPHPLTLFPGEPVAQLSFQFLTGPAQRPYGSPGLGSRYQGQTGATGPRTLWRGGR